MGFQSDESIVVAVLSDPSVAVAVPSLSESVKADNDAELNANFVRLLSIFRRDRIVSLRDRVRDHD